MKIGILGTGIVGRTHAAKLALLGHEVTIGTQNVTKTMSRKEKDEMGNIPFSEWYKENPKVKVATLAETAAKSEMLINALKGDVCVDALGKLSTEIGPKIVLDISNPLDFSKGLPPFLFISNTNSLAEEIQRALPKAKIVKTLNTMSAFIQVDPESHAKGDHHAFVSGNDAKVRTDVIAFLKKEYGWKHLIDLGDLTTARGAEMMLPLWLRLWGALNTPQFNFKIVQ